MQVYLSMYGLSSLTFVPSVSWTDTSPTEIRILLKSIQKHIQNRNSCPEVFCKKVFLEISQNSQENTWSCSSQVYNFNSGASFFLWILQSF